MMNRKTILGVLLICLLLLMGWGAYQLWGPVSSQPLDTGFREWLWTERRLDLLDTGFREWLWTERRLDLLLQMVLIFAGALSIAAILQVKETDDD